MGQNQSLIGVSASPLRIAVTRLLRRRKFIVDRKLQYSLLLTTFVYVLLFTFSLAASLFVPLVIRLHSLDPASMEASQTALKFLYLHSKFWPTVLLTFTIIALHSIHTSHKLAGPLYRFKVAFNAVKQGWLPRRISLRKGDYLQDEMEQINEMIGSLRTRIEGINAVQSDLCDALSECSRQLGSELPEHKRELLDDLVSKGNLLGKKLAEFRIEA